MQRIPNTMCFGGCIQALVLDGPFPVAQGLAAVFTEGYPITLGTQIQEIAFCPGAASSYWLLLWQTWPQHYLPWYPGRAGSWQGRAAEFWGWL